MALGEAVSLADVGRFAERRGARFEMLARAFAIALGQTPEREPQVMEGDAAGDLPFRSAPGAGRAGKARRIRRGPPASRRGWTETWRSCGETRACQPLSSWSRKCASAAENPLARPGEVRGRTRAPEKYRDVMKEARAILVRGEGKVAGEGPEVFREGARRRGVLALAQLLLEPEPVAVGGGGSLPEGRPESVRGSRRSSGPPPSKIRHGTRVEVTSGNSAVARRRATADPPEASAVGRGDGGISAWG